MFLGLKVIKNLMLNYKIKNMINWTVVIYIVATLMFAFLGSFDFKLKRNAEYQIEEMSLGIFGRVMLVGWILFTAIFITIALNK